VFNPIQEKVSSTVCVSKAEPPILVLVPPLCQQIITGLQEILANPAICYCC
jgi:hypothetical protein